MASTTQNNKQSVKALTFMESRAKLASLSIEDHTFCCAQHQKAFFDIQAVASGKKELSVNQLNFARDIWMGRASHKANSANVVVTAKCVERIEKAVVKDGKATKEKVLAPCHAEFDGTRAQIGEWKTKCEQHRS